MKLVILFFVLLLFGCGTASKKESLNIAVAANMQFAMDSIVSVFESNYDIKCNLTFGSSGMLTAQIENGAPFDLFFAANMTYPSYLYSKKAGENPKLYAQGRLVLVVDKHANYVNIEAVLSDSSIARIAIADNRTAPYGIAANQFLKRTNQWDQLKDKLVVGESISQVNQYISTKSVDAGFTSYSYTLKNGKDFNYFEVDAHHFEPIEQGVIVLNYGRNNHPEACDAFLEFISAKKCKAILNHFGYLVE